MADRRVTNTRKVEDGDIVLARCGENPVRVIWHLPLSGERFGF